MDSVGQTATSVLTDGVRQMSAEVLEAGPDVELFVGGLQFVPAGTEVGVEPQHRLGPQQHRLAAQVGADGNVCNTRTPVNVDSISQPKTRSTV